MINYQRAIYSQQTNKNSNQILNKNLEGNNTIQKPKKNVTFNENIIIYDVESYKELNKLLTYDDKQGLEEYYRSHHHGFYDYKSLYNIKHFSNPNTRIRRDPNDGCCILL